MRDQIMTDCAVDTVFVRLAAANPHPQSDLIYTNTYTLLVAVVLSAQATDSGVNKATRDLFKRVEAPDAMLALGEDGLKSFIKTIGLYNAKAKNIMALSQRLIDVYDGQVPSTREDLETLPGVGRKTANVVLNVAFGHPTMAVDTHVFRVAHRTGMAKGKTPEKVEEQLLRRIPEKWLRHAHHWLILHGRYVCKARTPQCLHCVISDVCLFNDKIKPVV